MLIKAVKERTAKKANLTIIKVEDRLVDETSLFSILYYVYTGAVQFVQLNPMQVVILMRAAEMYELNRLVWMCERYLRAAISLER